MKLVSLTLLAFVTPTFVATATAQEKPAKDKPAAADNGERRLLLQSLGLLAGSQVYQAYLNVGFTADAKAGASYDDKQLQQILNSVDNLLAATDKQMEKVARLDLTPADRAGIAEVRRLSSLVRRQAEELQAFWKTGDKARGARYESLRQEAWKGISRLLKLEKS